MPDKQVQLSKGFLLHNNSMRVKIKKVKEIELNLLSMENKYLLTQFIIPPNNSKYSQIQNKSNNSNLIFSRN